MLYGIVDSELPDVVAPPGYALGQLVAVGGTAMVYAVTSTGGARAILKWGRWRDRDMHARFAHEAEILKTLGAPLSPTLLAHGEHDRWPYLLMEEIRGETLATWMARAADRGSVAEIATILRRLAGALQQLHARGIVHCDLKPENVVPVTFACSISGSRRRKAARPRPPAELSAPSITWLPNSSEPAR
jgi:serine/threonine protein kinase